MASEVNDDLVLDVIFNPSLPGVACENTVKDCDQCVEEEDIEASVLSKVKEWEIEGVNAAESGDFDKSLEAFNSAVNFAPNHASSYNNRAQLYRLKGII